MKNLLLKYPLLPLLLLGIFYRKGHPLPLHDFANYYYGGALLEGGRFNPSVYFPADFNKASSNSVAVTSLQVTRPTRHSWLCFLCRFRCCRRWWPN
jgi:hypothetical protein